MSADGAPGWARAPAIVVAATLFMEQLDGTVLFTAVPSIAREFGVASTSITIATTAYLVASATFIPLGSWLASRLGDRAVFLGAIALFTLASLGCALSPDLAVLTTMRLLQGFGGAMMTPVWRLLALRGAKPGDFIRAIAYITWPALLAPVLAPLLGGALAVSVGWRWIFVVNVPLGVIVSIAAMRVLPRIRPRRAAFDGLGLLLCTVAVFALIVGTELLSNSGELVAALVSLAVFALLVAPAIRHLLRRDDPLFDLRVYAIPSFRAANAAGLAYRMAVTSAPFLVPLLLQDALGYDPLEAGALVAAIFVGNLGIKPFTTAILRRLRFKTVLLGSAAAGCLFLLCFALVDASVPPAVLFAILLLSGVFRSIGFTAYATLQFADVPAESMPSANSLSATAQQLATAVGIAVASTALRFAELLHPSGAAALPFHLAFLLMAAIAAIAVVGAARLPASTGDALRSR